LEPQNTILSPYFRLQKPQKGTNYSMSCQIKNNANLDLTDLQPHISGMYDHFHQKLGFQKPPVIVFDSDPSNQSNVLGKTAYYDPQSFEVHVYTDGRHPKDMLRSIAYELIHHQQNLEGRLDVGGYNGPGYYLENDKMKKIEQEAMLQGNAILREYEDGLKLEEMNKMSLKEWKNNELGGLLMKKFGILAEGKKPVPPQFEKYINDKKEGAKSNENDPDDDKPSAPAGGAEATADDEKESKNESVRRPDAAGDRGNFAGQKTDAELQGKLHEEELDEGQICEECGGKHYMKEEEIEERARGRRRTSELDPARDDDRTRPMQENLKRSIRKTLKENRAIRLKIKK
jgi:hypothetical protein